MSIKQVKRCIKCLGTRRVSIRGLCEHCREQARLFEKRKKSRRKVRTCATCDNRTRSKHCSDCRKNREKKTKTSQCYACNKIKEIHAFGLCRPCHRLASSYDGRFNKANPNAFRDEVKPRKKTQVATVEQNPIEAKTKNDEPEIDKNPIIYSPGSVERLEALMKRAEKGLSLFADHDEQIHDKTGTRLRPLPERPKSSRGGREARVTINIDSIG